MGEGQAMWIGFLWYFKAFLRAVVAFFLNIFSVVVGLFLPKVEEEERVYFEKKI